MLYNDNSTKKDWLNYLLSFLGILAIATSIIIPITLYYKYNVPSDSTESSDLKVTNEEITFIDKIKELGTVGDFLGGSTVGFLTFASVMFLLVTIRMQKKELEYTRKELYDSNIQYIISNHTMRTQKLEQPLFHSIDKLEIFLKDNEKELKTAFSKITSLLIISNHFKLPNLIFNKLNLSQDYETQNLFYKKIIEFLSLKITDFNDLELNEGNSRLNTFNVTLEHVITGDLKASDEHVNYIYTSFFNFLNEYKHDFLKFKLNNMTKDYSENTLDINSLNHISTWDNDLFISIISTGLILQDGLKKEKLDEIRTYINESLILRKTFKLLYTIFYLIDEITIIDLKELNVQENDKNKLQEILSFNTKTQERLVYFNLIYIVSSKYFLEILREISYNIYQENQILKEFIETTEMLDFNKNISSS